MPNTITITTCHQCILHEVAKGWLFCNACNRLFAKSPVPNVPEWCPQRLYIARKAGDKVG